MKRYLSIAILSSGLAIGGALMGVTASHARPLTLQHIYRPAIPHQAMVLPRSSMLRALPEFYIGHPQLLRVARVAERFAWGL